MDSSVAGPVSRATLGGLISNSNNITRGAKSQHDHRCSAGTQLRADSTQKGCSEKVTKNPNKSICSLSRDNSQATRNAPTKCRESGEVSHRLSQVTGRERMEKRVEGGGRRGSMVTAGHGQRESGVVTQTSER
ncbi:hypothetical protein RRG08_001167 [Elysia crispata]|uniref:Uncharacterized protein n=1 Tax=Elysia crispata TaxID=231223 RepID=A0AAE1A4G9_9GAST|nr:hypothetical protein RRG08_001167 [Elysia crispata]